MTDFQDFEPAPIAAARFVLADGRSFVFAASEDAHGKLHFSAIEGTPSMHSLDLEQVACFERIDAQGRVVESILRAAEPLQS
jgi:hypothetical protein